MIDCNKWRKEKGHECANMGKVKDSNYDGNCTARQFRFGPLKISGRWIFVDTSVHNDEVHISTLKIYFLQHSKYTTSHKKINGLNLFREIITVYYTIKYMCI